jgi:uncharacterized membrane protein
MSERWKYQLKTGIFWGLFMIIFMTIINWREKPIMTEVTLPKFYVKLAIYLIVGIFGLGYFNWKALKKQEDKKE